jgi:oxalate decarboxylase/phosphoglucose isomerase-like protein (cupin superfamily)
LPARISVSASAISRRHRSIHFAAPRLQTGLPGDLKAEQTQAAQGTGTVEKSFDFKASTMKPTKVTRGGEVKIIDSKIFPVTPISSAIVTLKPGLRELHWHPNADEWQYYITGKGRMTVFMYWTGEYGWIFSQCDADVAFCSTAPFA